MAVVGKNACMINRFKAYASTEILGLLIVKDHLCTDAKLHTTPNIYKQMTVSVIFDEIHGTCVDDLRVLMIGSSKILIFMMMMFLSLVFNHSKRQSEWDCCCTAHLAFCLSEREIDPISTHYNFEKVLTICVHLQFKSINACG